MMADVYVDQEVEQAKEILRAGNGKARVGHKTKPAQGKIAKDVVQRMVFAKLFDVRGSNVFLRRDA